MDPMLELLPEEKLLVALVRLAIKDARARNEKLRADACQWLWSVAPAIAKRAEVPPILQNEPRPPYAARIGLSSDDS